MTNQANNSDEQFLTVDNFRGGKMAFGRDPIWTIMNPHFDVAVFKAPFGVWTFICITWAREANGLNLQTNTTIVGHHGWTVADAKQAAIAHINAWLFSKNIDRKALLANLNH